MKSSLKVSTEGLPVGWERREDLFSCPTSWKMYAHGVLIAVSIDRDYRAGSHQDKYRIIATDEAAKNVARKHIDNHFSVLERKRERETKAFFEESERARKERQQAANLAILGNN